jgi:hypothetical protein
MLPRLFKFTQKQGTKTLPGCLERVRRHFRGLDGRDYRIGEPAPYNVTQDPPGTRDVARRRLPVLWGPHTAHHPSHARPELGHLLHNTEGILDTRLFEIQGASATRQPTRRAGGASEDRVRDGAGSDELCAQHGPEGVDAYEVAQSLDLNPIEHVWAALERDMKRIA